jgi:trehalose-phosphatase
VSAGPTAVTQAVLDALGPDDALLMLVDYDGTLTPIVDDPRDAWLSRPIRDHLAALAAADRVYVTILSGRSIEDLFARVGVPELIYAGCHGLEIEGPGLAFRHAAAEARRPAMRELVQTLRRRVASIPGAMIEPKNLSVAVHYRNVAPQVLERFETEVARTIGERSGLRLLGGRKVVEVLPTLGWDKGQGALWIRDALLAAGIRNVVTLCLGDDITDEIAFSALPPDAITVRVGIGPSSARYRLDGIADVEQLLGQLVATLAVPRPCE